MAKAPAFMWYPKDCDTDENVRAMDDAEFGFYVRCLNHAWLNDGLPTDIVEFARVMHKTTKQFLKLWSRVSRCFEKFETLTEVRFKNSRMEQQRQEQEIFRKSRIAAAKSKYANKSPVHVDATTDARTEHVDSSASATASATATKNKDQEPSVSAVAEPPKVKRVTGTRFTETKLPDDWLALAVDKLGWTPDRALDVFETFRNFWIAKPGKDGVKLDWKATWHNWCKNTKNEPAASQRKLPASTQPRNKALDSDENWITGAELIRQLEEKGL